LDTVLADARHPIGRAGPFTLSASCAETGVNLDELIVYVEGPAPATVDGYFTTPAGTTMVNGQLFPNSPVTLPSLNVPAGGTATAYYEGNVFSSAGNIHAEASFGLSSGRCRVSEVSYPFASASL
jgi:hypothetical protein